MQRELFPGCWDNSAAGHVDVGETNLQAAQREMKEELGLEDLILQKQGGYYVEVTNEWRLMRRFTEAYQLTLPDNLHEEIKISPEEVDDIVWMDISEVQALVVGYPELATDGLEQVITRFF
jgi:8-oxo-dGTP pyrophosphatase MutT (NUDIX family)